MGTLGEGATPPVALDILGTAVHGMTLDEAAARLIAAARTRRSLTVCPRDAHGVIRARSDAGLREAHAAADLITADGIPLVWLQKAAGLHRVTRVYGPDLMHRVCDLGRNHGLRHAFLGGGPGIAVRTAETLSARYPGLQVALADGLPMRPPGYRPAPGDDADAIAALNRCEADMLWLSLGSPRQELWLEANRAKLRVPVRTGVGAAFDFVTGTVAQAPRPIRAAGLEWAWRLALEPRRLARRYLLTIPAFVLLCVRERPWRNRPI